MAPEPATSYLWTEIPRTISLAEYETVILDLTPFEKPDTKEFADAYLPEVEKFARLFFRKDSEIIAIGRPDAEFDRSKFGYRAFQYTSFWMPRYFPDIEHREAGQEFDIISPEFTYYLANVRRWKYFWKPEIDYRIPKMYHPVQYGDYLGAVGLSGHHVTPIIEPIAKTGFDTWIAFRMQYHVLHRETGDLIASSGHMTFLPPTTEISTAEAVAQLLRERYRIGTQKEPPAWVFGYSLPRISYAEARIKEIDRQLVELQAERRLAVENHSNEGRFLALLYEQGEDVLEPLVRDALRALGAKVTDPERRGVEDGRLVDPYGRKAVLEIKGRENQLRLQDVRQLQDWVGKLQNDGWIKGILIANLFRNKHPSDRGDIYGSNALESAVRNKLTLVTTTQLFRALQCHQAGTLNLREFWDVLGGSAGPCGLPELD